MKTTKKIFFLMCLALTSITYTMDDEDTESRTSRSKELVIQKPRMVSKRSPVIDLSSIPEVIESECLSRRQLLTLHFLGLKHAGEGKVTQPAMIVPLKKELTRFKS